MTRPHHGFIPSSAEDLLRRRVKAELRKRMRGLRASVPLQASAQRAAAIIERLEAMDVVLAARSVALFWPIEARREVDLRPFDRSLRARGIAIAYPAIVPESGAMVLRFVDDPSVLEERGYGFQEPPPGAREAQRGDLSVIVVPALAFDPSGYRIGYGAGYYDRTLPQFAPPAVTVAVGYDFQLVAEIPVQPMDVAVDWIVTDRRVLACSTSAAP